ncbi:MAG: STAS/SEC14 domain-containing protein [Gammaproteobacteria bacterium]|jgi:hypothetical protein|uniref:STAS/SEC14 domain-containing protein n=1 Tax=Oceanibaculum nanhaiense TaxID=1909734 RepID=UPI0032EB13BC
MSLAIQELGPATFELAAAGMLDKDDYEQFVPLAERNIAEHGHINLLIDITHFRGWSPPALWEDLKFDRKHYDDVARLALVGEGRVDELMARISRLFTGGEVRYFDAGEIDAARTWVSVPA